MNYIEQYYIGLNKIVDALSLWRFVFQVASDHLGHKSIRFRYQDDQYEINGVVPKAHMKAVPVYDPVIRYPADTAIPAKQYSITAKIEYSPLHFGIWKVGDMQEVIVDTDPAVIIDYCLDHFHTYENYRRHRDQHR